MAEESTIVTGPPVVDLKEVRRLVEAAVGQVLPLIQVTECPMFEAGQYTAVNHRSDPLWPRSAEELSVVLSTKLYRWYEAQKDEEKPFLAMAFYLYAVNSHT